MIAPRLTGELVAGAVIVVLGLTLVGAERANGRLHTQLDACDKSRGELIARIQKTAAEEAKRYEATEAQHLADCRAAYNAGAGKLRDDEAVRAGLYVPRQRPGQANGPAAGAGHGR